MTTEGGTATLDSSTTAAVTGAGLLDSKNQQSLSKAAQVGDPDQGVTDQRVRPDWCPEPFYDAKTGEVRAEAAIKSWREITAQRDQLSQQLKNGTDPAPESPDKYFAPESFKDGKLVLGEDAAAWGEITQDDPILQGFAKACHEQGIGAKKFAALLPKVLETLAPALPQPVNLESEMALLNQSTGGKGEQVLESMDRWIARNVSTREWTDDEAALARQVGSTAVGVKFLSKLMNASGTQPIPIGNSIAGTAQGVEDWRMMIADKLYQDPGPAGDAHRAKVRQLGAKLFPGTEGEPQVLRY